MCPTTPRFPNGISQLMMQRSAGGSYVCWRCLSRGLQPKPSLVRRPFSAATSRNLSAFRAHAGVRVRRCLHCDTSLVRVLTLCSPSQLFKKQQPNRTRTRTTPPKTQSSNRAKPPRREPYQFVNVSVNGKPRTGTRPRSLWPSITATPVGHPTI